MVCNKKIIISKKMQIYLGRVEDAGESCQGNLSFCVGCQYSSTLVPLIFQPFGKNLADSSEILYY